MSDLDPKHEKFAQCVVAGMTKREAAIEAGYSPSDATSRGSKLSRRPEIAARIHELTQGVEKALQEKLCINTERVLEELSKIAFAEIKPEDVKPADKKAALDSIAKHLGMFRERLEVTGNLPSIEIVFVRSESETQG
jgi:phage terminase small subunit